MGQVRAETLDDYLIRTWQETAPHGLGDDPGRLCVTTGTIAERNLKRTLTKAGIPASRAADYTAIEEIARALVSAHHGTRAALVDATLRQRAISEILDDAETATPTTALEQLASRIEWTDEAVEQFATELDAYYRASNAGALDTAERDHDALRALADALDDPFARWKSEQGLEAFAAVHRELEDRMADLPPHVYLSRSHLVAAGREYLAAEWDDVYPSIEWVGIATVNVFDNPTVRFVKVLDEYSGAPDVDLFFRDGTRESLVDRLEAVGLDIEQKRGHRPVPADAAADAADIAHNTFSRRAPAESLQLIEAPDRRREIEVVTDRLRELFAEGVAPDDVLVVARDAGEYRPLVEDVFTNNEFPSHVETRLPMANLPAYRFLKATIDLIAQQATNADEPVEYTAVIDPLRLGVCLSKESDAPWPVPQAEFLRLEEQLAAADEADGARPISDWQAYARDRTGVEWDIAEQFLKWVIDEAGEPLDDGRRLTTWADTLLENHIHQTVRDDVESPAGPMVDPSRCDLSSKHSSHYATRVRDQTDRLRAYFDRAVEFAPGEEATPGWQLAARTVGDVMGQESIGTRNRDASAVRVVDAGNTYFLDAEHVFVLGLSAEEFPQEFTTPTFVHEDLHEAVYEAAVGETGQSAHVFYESQTSQHEQELDLYEVATGACTDSLTLVHHYLDAESDPVAWSSFVDFLDPQASDEYVTRISVDDWLPSEVDDDESDYWSRLAGRDRLRAYTFHAADTEHVAGPAITPTAFQRLAFWTDEDAYDEAIRPRVGRLTTGQFRIAVDERDAGISADLDLEAIAGPPASAHETDLFGQCELKYYFYQYLFARDGDGIDRQSIPAGGEQAPTSRFGRLPAAVRDGYLSDRYRSAVRTLIADLAPDRQATLGAFDDESAVIGWWHEHKPTGAPASVAQSLVGEYQQVQIERQHGIDRDWRWVDGREVMVDGQLFRLPPHRVDTVRLGGAQSDADCEGAQTYQLPVFYVAEREAAENALKFCWEESDNTTERPEICGDICRQCDNRPNCTVETKYTHDHRLHGAATAYDVPLGVLFVEQGMSRAAGRRGYVVERGGVDSWPADLERHLVGVSPTQWQNNAKTWQRELATHLRSMQPTTEVEYQVDPQFVDDGTDRYGAFDGSGDDGCATCVYRDLCQLPQKVNER